MISRGGLKMKKILPVLIIFILFNCASPPRTFVKTMEPTWAAVPIRSGLQYDVAWSTIVDLLIRKFDLEVLNKDEGYIRTGWLYTWTGELLDNYRVKVVIKFSANRKVLGIKSEAHYSKGGKWVQGTDEELLRTLKADIMGLVGRVTR